MGFLDDLGNAIKKVEEDVKKSGLDQQLKGLEQDLNKAGKNLSQEAGKAMAPANPGSASPAPAASAAPVTPAGQQPAKANHPGYAKITAWMRRNYKDRLAVSGDISQTRLQLEQVTAEATHGLS